MYKFCIKRLFRSAHPSGSSRNLSGLLFCLLLFTTCADTPPGAVADTPFTALTADQTGIDFVNRVADERTDRGLHNYDYFYNGGGVAIGDINNDGLPDVFFCGSDTENRLYVNEGDFRFTDISAEAGIQSNKFATGATFVDINQDGLLDIYVCNSGPYFSAEYLTNELYINEGNNRFTEQAAAYGIADGSRSTQAAFFDMDRDGDLDLWVMNHGLRNRGGGSNVWIQRARELPPEQYKQECSTLYRNDGNGRFTDISEAAGIQKIGFGLGLAIRDIDEDGWLDVYVANDYFIPDFLFINNGNGTFTDKTEKKLSHTPYYSMGCDIADFNNDGLNDLVVVDMTPADHVRNKTLMSSMDVNGFRMLTEYFKYAPQYMFNVLQLNQGKGIMSDIALAAGVSQTDWSWAALLADFDNDGWKDLYVTNGYRKDTKNNDWKNELARIRETKGAAYSPADYYAHLATAGVNPVPNQMFRNKNGLQFESATDAWGFDTPSFSNGAAYADLDQDGDLDLVVNNFDQPAFVYRNNSRERDATHYLRFQLTDSERGAVGTLHSRVCLYYGDAMQCHDNAFVRGFQSQMEPIVHFGVGQTERIDRAVITWPDGQQTTLEQPALDRVHTIDRAKARLTPAPQQQSDPLFTNIASEYVTPRFVHQENEYDDFATEVLLPHRQSTLGPALAVGDVNNDGREDFYVGGAKDQVGALYLQEASGRFVVAQVSAFAQDAPYEDAGARLFDSDGDGDLDLYVASGGGGEFAGQERWLQDRLYLNDGNGGFRPAPNALPRITSSTRTIAPADWDGDGDTDLFVGGRTVPGRYPLAPLSYLLINENGTFRDRTEELAPALRSPGMVTAALWTDTDNDGRDDLVLAGEWMPISVYRNTNDGLSPRTDLSELDQSHGWWNSLSTADIDNDGDLDLVAGNIGLNNKFHPSPEKPLYVYANDFDENGSLDIVLSKIYEGKQVPVRGKECSSTQMPFLNEKFPSFEEFANADLATIYEEQALEAAVSHTAYTFASVWLENRGDGHYVVHELPLEAQLSPINGIIVADIDADGHLDLLVAGNRFKTEVETPQYDAGKGLILHGDGQGNFTTDLHMLRTGLFLHKDVQDIQRIHIGPRQTPGFVVANNDSALDLYVYRK